MIYFAYGSNMSSTRLIERTPSARFREVAALPGYVLRVHKRGRDGSGKCNAVQTGCIDDRVWGVLYEIDINEMAILDRYEGVPTEYQNRKIDVVTKSGPILAHAYFALKRTIDDGMVPFDWYMRHVIDGALEHDLPAEYVRRLRVIPTQPGSSER